MVLPLARQRTGALKWLLTRSQIKIHSSTRVKLRGLWQFRSAHCKLGVQKASALRLSAWDAQYGIADEH